MTTRSNVVAVGIGLVAGGLIFGGGAAVGAAVYDARNADKVDGLHAAKANATKAQRAKKLVATDAQGKLPAGAVPRQVVFAFDNDVFPRLFTSTTPEDVPDLNATVRMPKAGNLLVTFSAESACSGGGGDGNWCAVDILVDGLPTTGDDDDAFDSDDGSTEGEFSWESHSIQRTIPVSAGVHTVTVQAYLGYAPVSGIFNLDDSVLTVLGIM